jgi:hypothetical protein
MDALADLTRDGGHGHARSRLKVNKALVNAVVLD